MHLKEDLSCRNKEELTFEQADKIISAVKNIQQLLRSKAEKGAVQYGFTAPQLGVIFQLYYTPSITLNELSDRMMISKSTVSGIIDRLAKQGVVKREIPGNNRRIVNLSISEEFKKSNNVPEMRKKYISYFIASTVKKEDNLEIEKIIYGLEKFYSLLKYDESHESE